MHDVPEGEVSEFFPHLSIIANYMAWKNVFIYHLSTFSEARISPRVENSANSLYITYMLC